MPLRLPALTALRAFEAAARLRSFKQAAQELSVTPTAVSHRIRALEDELGRALFVRRVRAVELTPEGELLHAAVGSGLQTIALAIDRIRRPERPSVTLSTTPAFAAKWLVPRLGAFQARHPGIDLHVHASTTPVDLDAGTVDLAIRYGRGRYPGVDARLLLRDRFAAVASPSLRAASRPDPARWPLIHFEWRRQLPADLGWSAWARAAGRPLPEPPAGVRYSEESHAIQAAVAGQGVALLSLVLVEEELRLGLLRVLAGPVLEGLSYHLLKSARRPPSDAVSAVEAWLAEVAAAAPAGPSRRRRAA